MRQQHDATNTALENLKDAGLTLADSDQDIRGRKVVDQNGFDVGHISALFIDVAERKVRMLEIRARGFLGIGDRYFRLPIDAITKVAKDEVGVGRKRRTSSCCGGMSARTMVASVSYSMTRPPR